MKTKARTGLVLGIMITSIILCCSLAWGNSGAENSVPETIRKAQSPNQEELVQLRWGQEGDRRLPEIFVNGKLVLRIRAAAGGYTSWQRAELVTTRLRQLVQLNADFSEIAPGLENGQVVIRAGPKLIITVDQRSAAANNTTAPDLALAWTNNIRCSLEVAPIKADDVWQAMGRERAVTARASWYGSRFHGRPTASGELYDQNVFTAAHRTLPFGTLVLVSNPATEKSVVVRINDRGPFVKGRIIDLSLAAARAIGMEESGVADIQMTVIGP